MMQDVEPDFGPAFWDRAGLKPGGTRFAAKMAALPFVAISGGIAYTFKFRDTVNFAL